MTEQRVEPRTEAGVREVVTLEPPYSAYWRQVLTDVIYEAIHNPPGGPKNVPSGQIAEAVVARLEAASVAEAAPPLEAIGEVLAFTVREVEGGRYECIVCGEDVSQRPFKHENDCDAEVVRAWLSQPSPAAPPLPEALDVGRLKRAVVAVGARSFDLRASDRDIEQIAIEYERSNE